MAVPAGFTDVSGNRLLRGDGTNVTNATAVFTPRFPFRAGGGGQVINVPVPSPVVDGAFDIALADSTLSNPQFVGYKMQVIDDVSGEVVMDYGLIQPEGPAFSVDTIIPAGPGYVIRVVGPTGPAGPPGASADIITEMVGYMDTAQAAALTAASVVASIQEYGGAGNWNGAAGTENYAKLQAAITALGVGATIRFPWIAGASNVYYFSTADWTAFNQCVLMPDIGIRFACANDNFLYGNGNKLKTTAPLPLDLLNVNATMIAGDKTQRNLYEKGIFLSDADLDRSVVLPVSGTADMAPGTVSWNTGDAFSAAVFTASDAASVTLPPMAGSNFFTALRRMTPGDELICDPEIPSASAGLMGVFVRGDGGYAWAAFSADAIVSNHNWGRKDVGQASTDGTIPAWLGLGNHSSYAPGLSRLSVRVLDYGTFAVCLNGVVVYVGTVNGPISHAGFCVYQTTSNCVFNNLVLARNKDFGGAGLANVLILGDSKTANRIDDWTQYFRDTLDAASGIRVTSLTNLAVSGATSGAQLATLTGAGVPTTPYPPNVCMMDVGTNDVQGLLGAPGLIANIDAMIALVRAASPSCKFVLADFSLWYTQGQNPGKGQLSSNYDQGAPYRAAIARYAAVNGHKWVDLGQALGFLTSHFSHSLAVTPTLASFVEDLLQDNIHPSSFTARLQGFAYARAVAAVLAGVKPTQSSDWFTLAVAAYAAGVTQFAGEALRYRFDRDGLVHLSGTLTLAGIASGATVLQLPPALWPERQVRVPALFDAGITGRLEVDTVGVVKVFNVTAGTPANLFIESLSWKPSNGR